MNVTGICITWNRPQLLGRSIHCFLQQTNLASRLIILDDAGQYTSQQEEGWSLLSVPKRYSTMGEKRNAAVDLAIKHYPQTDGIMLWDDDDVYFPHTVQCVSDALKLKEWAQPRLVLELSGDEGSLHQVETFGRKRYDICYGGCWAWRLGDLTNAGRFAVTNHSEDLKIAKIFQKKFGDSANSTSEGKPWYYYNRLNNSISGEGRNFYTLRGQQKIEFVGKPSIGWNGPNIFDLPISTDIHPRPW